MEKIKYRLNNDGQRHRFCQSFDKEKIFVKQAGQKINVYDKIQAASEDTDIYKVMEKYHTLEPLGRKDEGIFADFTGIQNIEDAHEKVEAAQELWRMLPADLRAEMNNNPTELLKNGQTALEKYFKKKAEPKPIKPIEPKPINEVETNE